jgi:hypothetical protein
LPGIYPDDLSIDPKLQIIGNHKSVNSCAVISSSKKLLVGIESVSDLGPGKEIGKICLIKTLLNYFGT